MSLTETQALQASETIHDVCGHSAIRPTDDSGFEVFCILKNQQHELPGDQGCFLEVGGDCPQGKQTETLLEGAKTIFEMLATGRALVLEQAPLPKGQ